MLFRVQYTRALLILARCTNFFGNARVYCTLNNIHTFTGYTGYDPEVSASSSALTPGIDNSSYPRSKSWVVGVNLTF